MFTASHYLAWHDTDLTLANIIFIPFFCQYKLSPDKHRIIVLVSWLFLPRYWHCQYYQYYCQNYPGSVLLLPIAACCWIGENLVCSDFCVPLLLSARVRLPNHGYKRNLLTKIQKKVLMDLFVVFENYEGMFFLC